MNAMTTRRSQAGVVTPAPGVTRPNVGLLGAAVFIVAESVFFMGLFLAYFYLRAESGTPWVRPDVSLIPPLANTAVLAASVVAITWAERGIARGDQGRLTVGVVIAAALGLVFMAVQSFEFASLAQLGFTPQIGAFGSTFFALLVFHVLRVFAGVIFMVIVLIRALLGQLSQRRRTVVQACALYWYFIATVWLVVFLVLYGG